MVESVSLHSNLKKARKERNLSQNDVAAKLGISRQAISRWENGAAYPDIDNLTLLSEVYGISVDELLGQKQRIVRKNPQKRRGSLKAPPL